MCNFSTIAIDSRPHFECIVTLVRCFLLKQLLEKLHEKWNSVKQQPYPAMYSSVYGGIILDPAMMVIPMDDHMVHRGHGVFDTAIIFDGYESSLVP